MAEPTDSWTEDLIWLAGRMQEEDREERIDAIRQIIAGANEATTYIQDVHLSRVRELLRNEIDPEVRFHLTHLLSAMGDESVRRNPSILAGVNPDALRKWLSQVEGHEIVKPKILTDIGFTSDVVDAVTFDGVFQTRRGLKKKRNGVSVYDFVAFLAHHINLRPDRYYHGRGRHCRELIAKLLGFLDQPDTSLPASERPTKKQKRESEKVVFETNFKTVHERCCQKRDKQNDFSDFDKLHQSDLFKKAHEELRRAFRGSSKWWAINEVRITAGGTAILTVEFAHSFSSYSFQYCEPEELQAKLANEKAALNYWAEPSS